VLSYEHGVTPLEPPNVGSIETGGYYHEKAKLGGLVVKDDGNTIKVYGPGEVEIPLASLPAGTITEQTMFDGREETDVKVTEIDMSKLNDSGHFPSNGLLYAYRTDASPQQPNGVRLKNASELRGKLTVVSPVPVYVWGNYNTVNKKRSAIITDAINLLSNAWNNTKGNGQLPDASDTTYNTAIISGNTITNPTGTDPTKPDYMYDPNGLQYRYCGGFENMPRFHERWSGVPCRINGSFVSLWQSKIGTGAWVYGSDNYCAPQRLWSFDTDFRNASNLPPFTPVVVGTSQVVWWVE
jgi:hypothetical protein